MPNDKAQVSWRRGTPWKGRRVSRRSRRWGGRCDGLNVVLSHCGTIEQIFQLWKVVVGILHIERIHWPRHGDANEFIPAWLAPRCWYTWYVLRISGTFYPWKLKTKQSSHLMPSDRSRWVIKTPSLDRNSCLVASTIKNYLTIHNKYISTTDHIRNNNHVYKKYAWKTVDDKNTHRSTMRISEANLNFNIIFFARRCLVKRSWLDCNEKIVSNRFRTAEITFRNSIGTRDDGARVLPAYKLQKSVSKMQELFSIT